ncbi:TetR-like C-terminal domain-containing protein [Leifsonia sp. NPDC058194]|uniref:TetR-like C-terminal domain-containing protein n=1 Tax=Leifsonia sp. NPDC058194 TaxID=3346374 RepID=UPI0036DA9AEA
MSDTSPPPLGRPRNAAIDDALHRALEELVAEAGVTSVTVHDLIGRAGVTRDAFYRRYNSLGHFLVAVATSRYRVDPSEDTGSLRGDLRVVVADQAAMYTDGVSRDLLPLLLDACARDRVVADLFESRFLRLQRESTARVIERAVERGEIPPVDDLPYVLDLVYGPALLRAALPGNAPPDDAFVDRVVNTVARELGAAPA